MGAPGEKEKDETYINPPKLKEEGRLDVEDALDWLGERINLLELVMTSATEKELAKLLKEKGGKKREEEEEESRAEEEEKGGGEE